MTRFEKVELKIAAAKLIRVDKTHVGKYYTDDKKYHEIVGTKTLENYKKYGFDARESLGTKSVLKIGITR